MSIAPHASKRYQPLTITDAAQVLGASGLFAHGRASVVDRAVVFRAFEAGAKLV